MSRKRETAFAVWITGLPASGKSTLTTELVRQMREIGVQPAVLESDTMRKELSMSGYDEEDRERFYAALAFIARVLTEHGIPVIIDATANRRSYRDPARRKISRFAEVFVECPLERCMERDPKGIYRRAREGETLHVPGIQEAYEPPEHPDVRIDGDRASAPESARRVLEALIGKGFLLPAANPDVAEKTPGAFGRITPAILSGLSGATLCSGTAVLTFFLWQQGDFFRSDPETTGGFLLVGVLLILLLGGIFLLAHGFIDLLRDLRRSRKERAEHRTTAARDESERKRVA